MFERRKKTQSELRWNRGQLQETPHSEVQDGKLTRFPGWPHGFDPCKLEQTDDL